MSSRVHEAVKAVALCHNVTPVYEARGAAGETEVAEADQDFSDDNRTYQASSPDEVSHRGPRPRQARRRRQRLPWLLPASPGLDRGWGPMWPWLLWVVLAPLALAGISALPSVPSEPLCS